MSRSPRWLSPLAFFATVAIVFTACGGTPAPSASGTAPSASTAAASTAAFTAMAYPESGPAPCGVAPYTGQLKKITALDRPTVEFQLCGRRPTSCRRSLSVPSVFTTPTGSQSTRPDKSTTQPNGTGPYKLEEWSKGNRMVFDAFAGYWGTKALTPEPEFRWSDEAAQRLLDLQSNTVDGNRQPGDGRHRHDPGDSNLSSSTPATGPQHLVPWYEQHPEAVRQRQGPPGDRHGHRPRADRQELLPGWLDRRRLLHAVRDRVRLRRRQELGFDPPAAKKLLADAGYPNGFTTKIHFRAAVRGYNPDPPVIATEISQQLKKNLGITATVTLLESAAMLDGFAAGTLPGISMVGWGADYPDPSNFLDYHFGSGSGKKFGTPFQDIVDALNTGVATADPAARTAAYTTANNLIKQHVPAVIVAHGASGAAFKADVDGGYASVFGAEVFATMQAADRDARLHAERRAAQPLLRRRDGRRDPPRLRAGQRVALPLQGRRRRKPSRPSPKGARPTPTPRSGPASCGPA